MASCEELAQGGRSAFEKADFAQADHQAFALLLEFHHVAADLRGQRLFDLLLDAQHVAGKHGIAQGALGGLHEAAAGPALRTTFSIACAS